MPIEVLGIVPPAPAALAVQAAAEAAALLLVRQLLEIPQLDRLMREATRDLVAAGRVIITIEASERVPGLRLVIIPAPDAETLQ